MKIAQMLENLIKDENTEDRLWNVPDDLLYEFNLQQHSDLSLEDTDRFKCYWLAKHLCTDSHVGFRVYFLDDKPIAVSHQAGRKCDENFEWVSMEAFKNTHSFLLSLIEDDELPTPTLVDLGEEIGEGYSVNYVGQLLTKHVMYDNCMVVVTKEEETVNGKYNFDIIEIKHPIKGLMEVKITDILVPWNA